MPAIIAWLAGLGFVKAASVLTGMAAVGIAFYKYSYEICIMAAMISLLFTMFGFRMARTGVLFSLALYVITQMLGVALR